MEHIDTLELIELACLAGINVVYDIGANVGTWTLLAKSVIPQACIHAFEPFPGHQIEFRRAFQGRQDVTLHSIAVGSDNGVQLLHVTDFTDASSLLQPTEISSSQFEVREVARCPVKVCRLDEYRLDKDLPWPDLIKLDVQGYELEALRGAPECLRSVKAVVAEVTFVEYYEGQCRFHEVAAYLAEFGLFIRAFGWNTPRGIPIGYTDVLFMRGGM